MAGSYAPRNLSNMKMYGRRWAEFFEGSFARIHEPGIGDYSRARLLQVLKKTLRKELSALRGFLGWCVERGWLDKVPEFPKLPKKATGVRSGPHRAEPVEVTEGQVRRFLAKLPAWSERSPRGENQKRFPVRLYFEFLWETGLRPVTVATLSVPEHYLRGAKVLRITDASDKARFGRELPLSNRAAAILEELCPPSGPIFGRHSYRTYLWKAREAAKMPQGFSTYDLRHGRATDLLEKSGGNLLGVAYLLGHKHTTTTDKYLKASVRHAESVLRSSGGKTGGKRG